MATDHRIVCPALGLANEAGEVAGKVKKILQDRQGRISDAGRQPRHDPTAVHKGGNIAIRDVELFDDHFWVNVKSGWYDGKGNLGHSPVN